MKVAILGCGPAGLLAAHAVALAGHEPEVFSRKDKSQMPGAQYMHTSIPDLTSSEPDDFIHFFRKGSKAGYAKKVYGFASAACSWDQFPEGKHPAWNMGAAYDELWNMYDPIIADVDIDGGYVEDIVDEYPLVFSSIPLPHICIEPGVHHFSSQDIWIATAESPSLPPDIADENRIIYNGSEGTPWYRFSNLWGHRAWEYGEARLDSQKGTKPLYTTCNCHPKAKRIGRFGRWEKGVLVTDAFQEAQSVLQSL